jgi:hypothetical protein
MLVWRLAYIIGGISLATHYSLVSQSSNVLDDNRGVFYGSGIASPDIVLIRLDASSGGQMYWSVAVIRCLRTPFLLPWVQTRM